MKRIIPFIFFLAGNISFLCAQSPDILFPKDFGIWCSVNFSKKINKKTDFEFSEEIRLKNNISSLKSSFTDIGLKRELSKKADASVTYRLITRSLQAPFQHRLIIDLSYTEKIKKLSAQFRLRFQRQYEIEKLPENYLRPKLSFKYKLSKNIRPFADVEVFVPFAVPHYIDDFRWSIGAEYAFTKKLSAKLFYLIDKEIQVRYPLTTYVVGASVSIDL